MIAVASFNPMAAILVLIGGVALTFTISTWRGDR